MTTVTLQPVTADEAKHLLLVKIDEIRRRCGNDQPFQLPRLGSLGIVCDTLSDRNALEWLIRFDLVEQVPPVAAPPGLEIWLVRLTQPGVEAVAAAATPPPSAKPPIGFGSQ